MTQDNLEGRTNCILNLLSRAIKSIIELLYIPHSVQVS